MRTTPLFIAVIALEACVIDSVPTPESNPRPNYDTGAWSGDGDSAPPGSVPSGVTFIRGRLYASTDGGGPTVLVVGTPYAVPPNGFVGAENATTHTWVQRPVASDGSFWLSIGGKVGDELRLVYFRAPAETLAQVLMTVSPCPESALSVSRGLGTAATDSAPALTVSSPDAAGRVKVSGAAGVVSPAMTIVLTSSTGSAAAGEALQDGSFVLEIAAQSGDTVTLFAVDPSVNHAGGPLTTLTVP